MKKEQALYKRERAAFAALHRFQHEFCWPALRLDMDRWIPELLHVLELNWAICSGSIVPSNIATLSAVR